MRTVRRLLPTPQESLSDAEIAEHYKAPRRPWLRANMVSTVDGAAAGGDGVSSSVSSSADRAVFSILRTWSDAVLVGAGTVRAERYTRLPANRAFAEARRARGQSPAPVLAVVSGSARLDYERLTNTDGGELLLYTGEDAPGLAEAREHLTAHELRVAVGGWTVPEIVADLHRLGLENVLCEGGPGYLAQVAASGMLDELCVTYSPLLAAGEAGRIAEGPDASLALRLEGLLEADSTLLARYARAD